MLACLLHVYVGLHGNNSVCSLMSESIVESLLRHCILCGLYYIIYTKEANGHCIIIRQRKQRTDSQSGGR